VRSLELLKYFQQLLFQLIVLIETTEFDCCHSLQYINQSLYQQRFQMDLVNEFEAEPAEPLPATVIMADELSFNHFFTT